MPRVNVKKELDVLGIKQKDFAKMVGVEQETVSRWVNGHQDVPQYAKLIIKLLLQRQEHRQWLVDLSDLMLIKES